VHSSVWFIAFAKEVGALDRETKGVRMFGKMLKKIGARVVSVCKTVARNSKAIVVGGVLAGSALVAQCQTDATAIATQAQTAFGVVAPITITIAAFYVILRIAKRVVH
jgi:hypothetical protein